ncbi:MAG: hypothetical protein IPK97_10155 [Ahniella sp.]|nr:hypothetical protein [Ahniella sp.]
MRRILAVLLMSGLAGTASACAEPEVWAKSLFTEHYEFYAGEPDAAVQALTTEQFGALLRQEAAYADGEVGHLGYDPWLGAQDGEIASPRFSVESRDETVAVVAMSFRLKMSEDEAGRASAAHLVLHKAEGGCWLLNEFVTPLGESLSFLFSQP